MSLSPTTREKLEALRERAKRGKVLGTVMLLFSITLSGVVVFYDPLGVSGNFPVVFLLTLFPIIISLSVMAWYWIFPGRTVEMVELLSQSLDGDVYFCDKCVYVDMGPIVFLTLPSSYNFFFIIPSGTPEPYEGPVVRRINFEPVQAGEMAEFEEIVVGGWVVHGFEAQVTFARKDCQYVKVNATLFFGLPSMGVGTGAWERSKLFPTPGELHEMLAQIGQRMGLGEND